MQGQIALGSGGLFGRGIGQSVQKIFYLPEAHTDFILAIIGEELGVAGVTAVLFLYGLLAYAGLRVAKAAKGAYAKLLAAGITSLILSQACLNVFAVLGLAPLTGVPLPFISYGATNLTVLLAGMGLLLNVAAGGQCPSARRGRIPPPWLRRSSSPRAGQRGTWCRRWPSPTRCGLRARTSSSSAASAPSARWCPPPATSCARSPSRGSAAATR